MLSANGEAGTPSKVQVLPSEFGGVACGVAALLEDSMSLNDTEKQNIGNFFDPNYLLKYYLPATSRNISVSMRLFCSHCFFIT